MATGTAQVVATKRDDDAEMVRIADIYTPQDGFNGLRHRVRFGGGHAQLPEPKPEDFKANAAWLAEHEAWEQLVQQFRHDGYQVKIRRAYIETEDDNTGEDDEPGSE